MYEQASLKIEIKENRLLNGDTFYLWHLSILTHKARKVNCIYALNRRNYVCPSEPSFKFSLKYNFFQSNNESSLGTKVRLVPYLKSIFLEDLNLASIKFKESRVHAKMQQKIKYLRDLRTINKSNECGDFHMYFIGSRQTYKIMKFLSDLYCQRSCEFDQQEPMIIPKTVFLKYS